jgi:IS5 family transposase
MSRLSVQQMTFGDLEMKARGLLSGTLKAIDELLEQAPGLVERVHQDLIAGLKKPRVGREGLRPVQVLRSFLLRRMEDLDLRSLRDRIDDGVSWRVFTGFDAQGVPGHDAFNRAFNKLRPETIRQINQIVLKQAVDLGLEDGQRLRVDTTVIETDIHFPTDCGLLWDSVRVITRETHRLLADVPKARSLFHDRTRRARRRYQEISRMTRQQRHHQQLPKYKHLILLTEEVVASARAVVAKARKKAASLVGTQPHKLQRIEERANRIDHFCSLADRAISQTRRRILHKEPVPVQDKIFSIFEPHTDLIVRGKTDRPVEFGHKVFLAESGSGLITDYHVLSGNPQDEIHVRPSLEAHQRSFGRVPQLYAGDRGFYSTANVTACSEAGVEVECIPQRGGGKTKERQAYEKSRPFRQGQRFRAGIEGRISVLLRGRGMRRCRSSGPQRFEVFFGLAVLANNLLVLASLIGSKHRHKRAA